MKRFFTILSLLSIGLVTGYSQQTATFAQYMFNGLAINPAYAGSHSAMEATFLGRFQNVGLPGAPTTQTFSIHSPLKNKRVGVGMLFIHDKISVVSQTGVHFSYAYRIPLKSNQASLSFGVQGGASIYNAQYSQLDLFNNPQNGGSDPLLSNDLRSSRPNIGAGIYYASKLTYVGISMPSMMNNVFDRGTGITTVNQAIPVILNAGHVFTLNKLLKVKPNFLFKMINDKPVEIDLNTTFLFDEVIWFGVSYKSAKQVIGITQFKINDQLQCGYSYTITGGPLKTAELGSHEFMVSYLFQYNKKGIVSPRYF
jgi:type IX secretion system PorP/SprF family membrane protein